MSYETEYEPVYDIEPMRMLRHHIEKDCLAMKRSMLREIEDGLAKALRERDELIRDMWEAFNEHPYVCVNPEVLRDRAREMGVEI